MSSTTTREGTAAALLGPAVAAGAAGLSMAAVAVVDPNVPGSWPVCPSLSQLGVLCPLCGGLRSAHALTELDVLGAFDANLLVPLLVLAAAVGWTRWVRRRWQGRPRPGPAPSWVGGAVAVVAVVYGVLRNLPGFEVLAP